MNLDAIRSKGTRFVVALACGRSCSAIDAALVRIKGSGASLHLKLIKFERFPFGPGLRNRLLTGRRTARELALLNFELGEKMAEAAQEMNKAAHEELLEVDFIAAQGHCVAHVPPRGPEGRVGSLEIGEAAVIAERTELPVVSDFSVRDLAAGGQGNPLVTYADWALFAREDRTVACLHLGNVASLCVIPPHFEEILAFDVGPANLIIDGATQILTSGSQEMDVKGRSAAKGVVIDEFLEYLLDHYYFNRVPPKSTGREDFGPDVYLRDAITGRKNQNLEDLVATVTAAVGYSIGRAYSRFVKPHYDVSRLIVSGGGVANRTLMKHIRKAFPDIVVRSSSEYGLPCDAFDACAIGILGSETVSAKPSNVPHASGARHPAVLGKVTLA
ncbi:MAG: anhydro-N-acetylmuramic acid kinase [bacterium]|nr:anhydro-N-acetylmuramic acid kinase [bacterium]